METKRNSREIGRSMRPNKGGKKFLPLDYEEGPERVGETAFDWF
jgi:hypothetical protein